MDIQNKKQIDFKFSKNWKIFLSWFQFYSSKTIGGLAWEFQEQKIQACFEHSNPGIVNWKKLWEDMRVWHKATVEKNGTVLWSEQQRQIETLMLGQLKELNKEQFVLVFLHNGKPSVDSQVMTYWDAVYTKENLEGDDNGLGGDETMDKITIININTILL
jgi:hypothetical protein